MGLSWDAWQIIGWTSIALGAITTVYLTVETIVRYIKNGKCRR